MTRQFCGRLCDLSFSRVKKSAPQNEKQTHLIFIISIRDALLS